MKRAVIVVSRSDYFWSHREAVARAARRAGFEVHVVTNLVTPRSDFDRIGIPVHHVPFPRGWSRPLSQLHMVARLARLYRRLSPSIVHHISLQAIVWGGFAAQTARVRGVINAFTGLGSLVLPGRMTLGRRIPWSLLRAASSSSAIALFQNTDDLADCLRRRVVRPDQVAVIRGSGVNVRQFAFAEPSCEPVVLMAARLIWPKGVREFVEAAKLARQRHCELRFVIAGVPDEQNRYACPSSWLREQDRRGIVEWWGDCEPIQELLYRSALVVAPTWYGEGVPKILLEAAACGRPMVATDHRGCREIVIPGRTGLLVPRHDPDRLANAVVRLWRDEGKREVMGRAARQLAIHEFSDTLVAQRTVELYRLQASRSSGQRSIGRPEDDRAATTGRPRILAAPAAAQRFQSWA